MTSNMEISWAQNGVTVRTRIPEHDAEPERIESRVFTDLRALQDYLEAVWNAQIAR